MAWIVGLVVRLWHPFPVCSIQHPRSMSRSELCFPLVSCKGQVVRLGIRQSEVQPVAVAN